MAYQDVNPVVDLIRFHGMLPQKKIATPFSLCYELTKRSTGTLYVGDCQVWRFIR